MAFPIDTGAYRPLALDPNAESLSDEQKAQWQTNIDIVRDTLVFFTSISNARGFAGHTGGAYDIVPEVLLADGFMRGSDGVYPVLFDEAGHRVAIQYAMSAFNGAMPFERLLHYREEDHDLYGHPEPTPDIGVRFASGRLGHLWAMVNGVALAHPDKAVVLFGSDGAQMEGDDAEAARLAVAQNLNVKVIVDDNNVTIAGHPTEYLPGFDVASTLSGHGLRVEAGPGEELDSLYARMHRAFGVEGPVAVVNHRVMAPGLPTIEGTIDGHEAIPVEPAVAYLEARGHQEAADYLRGLSKHAEPARDYLGSSDEVGSNRKTFGAVVSDILDELPEDERAARVMVIDTDLAGSTGLSTIKQRHPEVFVSGPISERGNLSAAAGFGFEGEGRTGVFSTFAAFLEMVVSEVTMARLNGCNLLCHFSHSGVDAIADNTSHFGINVFFGDNGVEEQPHTPLYFPADPHQLAAVVRHTMWEPGIRYVFSIRSEVPYILGGDGARMYDPETYAFDPARDEVVREGEDGWVVSYGDMLHRALDAVERLNADGRKVGLVNKVHLNLQDEETLARIGGAPFVLVVENQNVKTGLGGRFGTWLLERGLTPRYASMGVTRLGAGGTWAQVYHQGLGPDDILAKLRELAG